MTTWRRLAWALPVALSLACINKPPAETAPPPQPQRWVQPAPVCRDEPVYVERPAPVEGERIDEECYRGDCAWIRVCSVPDGEELCRVYERDVYDQARVARVQVRTIRVCEQPPPVERPPETAREAYAPAPRRGGGGGPVHVRGYYRRDGTYVRPHSRRR